MANKIQYHVIQFQNSQITGLVVDVLNNTYPNVEFNLHEVGNGVYEILVVGKYSDFIHPHTLSTFISSAVQFHQVVSVVVASLNVGIVND